MGNTAAAKLKVYINNKFVGETTGFSWESSARKKAIYAIDSTEPFEFAPSTTTIRGRISLLRPEGAGGLEGYGIATSFRNHSRHKYVSIMLFDRKSYLPVFMAERAVIQSQSWQVEARGILRGSIEFEAFDWKNEIGFLYGNHNV
jgi:hypothetical protein